MCCLEQLADVISAREMHINYHSRYAVGSEVVRADFAQQPPAERHGSASGAGDRDSVGIRAGRGSHLGRDRRRVRLCLLWGRHIGIPEHPNQ